MRGSSEVGVAAARVRTQAASCSVRNHQGGKGGPANGGDPSWATTTWTWNATWFSSRSAVTTPSRSGAEGREEGISSLDRAAGVPFQGGPDQQSVSWTLRTRRR